SVVHSLIFDSNARRVTGVRGIDGQTKAALELQARLGFLCAACLESPRILLNSATTEFPNGLANRRGELGHNLMDHHMGSGAEGILAGHADKMSFGYRPNGIYIPRFRNVKTQQKDFLRGYGNQGEGRRDDWTRAGTLSDVGLRFK